MGFMISDPEQVLIRCQHMTLTESEVEILVDGLVESAGREIRLRCSQLRENERNLMAHRAEVNDRQRVLSDGIIAHHEQEKVAGKRRNEELARAESINGPRRGN